MNKELTEKYIEFQMLSQQMQQMQQQASVLSHQANELKALSKNLSEISQTDENSEMFTNLGIGVHIKSTVKDIKKLLVNVGANTFVQKTPEETVKLVDKQAEELEKFLENMQQQLEITAGKAENLREEIANAQKKEK